MDNMSFWKISAGGNDFICIDNTDGRYDDFVESEKFPDFLIKVCRRGLSVGADGVIFAEKSTVAAADIQARFFEPDGSEVELCGNGTACFVYWVVTTGMVKHQEIAIQTKAGINNGRKKEDGRCGVCVPPPYNYKTDICITANNQLVFTDFIVTGTGHAVIYVTDIQEVKVADCGHAVRHHPAYGQPVNANFVQIFKEGHIGVRTFEFGVEAETLACGTGSASAAMLTAVRHKWDYKYLNGDEPVLVDVRGGITLKVWFMYNEQENCFTDVCLETFAKPVYKGELLNI